MLEQVGIRPAEPAFLDQDGHGKGQSHDNEHNKRHNPVTLQRVGDIKTPDSMRTPLLFVRTQCILDFAYLVAAEYGIG